MDLRPTRLGPLALLLAGAFFAPLPVVAQSAADVVDEMLRVYARNAQGVDDYTIVQEVMGTETRLYFEKEAVDGRPLFKLRQSSTAGVVQMGHEDDGTLNELYAAGDALSRSARYGGVEQIEGREAHLLVLEDLSSLGLSPTPAPAGAEFTPRQARLFVDAERSVPRRLEFEGEMAMEQGVFDVTSVIDMEDYREVDGFLLSHRSVVRIEGLGAVIDPEMRAQYEEMRRQLEALPESQRAMVEQMMRGQMEQVDALMSGEQDGMTIEIRVTDVRVNAGPPSP